MRRDRPSEVPSPRSGFARDSAALAGGMAVAGLLSYVFIAIGTRSIGATAFAPVSVMWTFWAATSAFITFPVQHWVIRTLEVDSDERRVVAALPGLAVTTLVVCVVAGGLSWVGREPLFGRSDAVFPLLAALIPVGSVLVGFTRGVLSGRERFTATALSLAGESTLRVTGAVVVVVLGGGAAWFGVAVIGGFAIGGAWSSALRLRSGATDGTIQHAALPFLGGVAGGSLLAQLVLTGGPVAAALIGATPASITAIFSALALFRAPYLLATGVASRFTGGLTRLVLSSDVVALRRLGARVVLGTGAVAALGAGGAALLGPGVLRLVFGSTVRVDALIAAVIAGGSLVALGTLVGTLLLVALDRPQAIFGIWTAALTAAVLWIMVAPGAPITRVAWALVVGEVVAGVGMVVATARWMRARGVTAS